MEPQPQDSIVVMLAKRLEYLPRYVVDYFLGLIVAMISDVTISTVTLAAVALGLAVGHWLLIVAFFFTLYSLLRITSLVASAIGGSGQLIAQALRQAPPSQQPTGMIMHPQGSPTPGPQAPPPTEPPVPAVTGEVVDGQPPRIPVTFPGS